MIQTLRAKWAWAREKPLFWANVVLIGVTAFIAILWPGPRVDGIPSDLRLRLWGIALQVVGVVTVWRDLTGTAGHFGKAGFLAATLQWLKRGFGGRNVTVSLRGSMVTATGMSATIKVRRRIDPTGTPE